MIISELYNKRSPELESTITSKRAKLPGCSRSLIAVALMNLGYTGYAQAQLEEVVVTAQRKAESVQDVPIAITAMSNTFLTETGISSTKELEFVTPGLTYGRQLTAAVPFIRGIGTQTTAAGQDASVSTYIDDVYYSSSLGSILTLNNIERIEVLKGPQGTLFGRNATGGLMHVITRDPQDETAGELELSYGNYDTFEAKFYGTIGVMDGVATDLAVLYSDQGEGYGENKATGGDVNETDEILVRNKWLISAGENTEIKLSADYGDTETSLGVAQRMDEGALGLDGQVYYGGLIGEGVPPEEAAAMAAQLATGSPDDFWDVNSRFDPTAEIDQWGISAHITHDFGDLNFVSITAYRETDAKQKFPQDATPFVPSLIDVSLEQFTETFSQEFRISTAGDNLDWMVGAFLLDEDAGYDIAELNGSFIAPLDALTDDNKQETFSWAVFAQGDYSFTENTILTAGIRYTEDERNASGTTQGTIGGAPFLSTDYDDTTTWEETTWRLALSHHFNDSTLAYVSYNRGFKSGLYNLNVLNPVNGLADPVEPETLDAYEIGLKTDMLDGRMRLNAAAFYYEYDDLQVSISVPGGNVLLNAAEATMYGGELEFSALLGDHWTAHAGLSLLDTEYEDFPEGPALMPSGFGGNILLPPTDLGGNELPRSPEYTFNTGVVYNVDTDFGSINASANYYYNDGFYWESENRTEQDSYEVVNAQVTWTSLEETYYVRIYGNNLTDEEYGVFGISSEVADFLSAAAPRTYGVRVGVNF
jgi:iron complex outermembrane recepter protein